MPWLAAYVDGVKPLVTGNDASVTVTVALGSRDLTDDTVTYTSQTSRTSTTGYCDFDSEARLHRARVQVSGDFHELIGVEFQQRPAGT